MKATTIQDLFEHELKDIYFAEQKIHKELEKMGKETNVPQVRQALSQHRQETAKQIKRLEQVFRALDKKARGLKCDGVMGLIAEKKAFMQDEKPSEEIREVFNLSAAAKTERYEITAYEGLIRLARILDLPKAVELLEENLQEEMDMLARVQQISDGMDMTTLMHAQAAA